MAKQRQRRSQGRSSQVSPRIYTLESEALTLADSPANTTIYQPPATATSVFKPSTFSFHNARVSLKAGSANTVIYAILRKVPQGYSSPAVAIADGNTSFVDVPNVLAYGTVYVYASTNDTMQRIDMRPLNRNMKVLAGETIVLQVVSDTASTGQSYDCLLEYSIQ